MNERRLWIGMIGGGLLVAAGLGGLIYLKNEDIDKATAKVAALRSNIQTARKTIEGTGNLEREVIVLRRRRLRWLELPPRNPRRRWCWRVPLRL